MKKKLAAILLFILAVSIAACGGNDSSEGSKPKVVDNKMQSTLGMDGKEAQVKLFIPAGDIVTTTAQLNEEKAELNIFHPYDETLKWIEDKLDELAFVRTVSEETRKNLAPTLLSEVFTGTIDGQPLTIVIYNTPPPPDGEEHFTPVFIYFYAVVI